MYAARYVGQEGYFAGPHPSLDEALGWFAAEDRPAEIVELSETGEQLKVVARLDECELVWVLEPDCKQIDPEKSPDAWIGELALIWKSFSQGKWKQEYFRVDQVKIAIVSHSLLDADSIAHHLVDSLHIPRQMFEVFSAGISTQHRNARGRTRLAVIYDTDLDYGTNGLSKEEFEEVMQRSLLSTVHYSGISVDKLQIYIGQ